MLPAFNDDGDLPPGVYVAPWSEIRQRFGSASTARVRAFKALRQLHDLALRTGALRRFYVFGSFVSSLPEPRDVDLVLIMAANFTVENCPSESQPLFFHLQAEARYGASVFWFRERALPKDFLRAWQLNRNGELRGILEVA